MSFLDHAALRRGRSSYPKAATRRSNDEAFMPRCPLTNRERIAVFIPASLAIRFNERPSTLMAAFKSSEVAVRRMRCASKDVHTRRPTVAADWRNVYRV